MELYKYMSFESFVDLVQSKSLCFVYPPVAWEDTYEGYALRAMKTAEGRERISEIFKERGQMDFADAILRDDVLSIVRYQSWSKAKDKVAMWSIYSYSSKAIMISTTSEKLEAISVNGKDHVKCMEVNYVKRNNLADELQGFKGLSCNTTYFFRSKRIEFKHEDEIRAYAATPLIMDKKTPLKVPVQDFQDFIDGVMVHPSAPSWYVGVVEDYCKINDIKFNGQSKLYSFEC